MKKDTKETKAMKAINKPKSKPKVKPTRKSMKLSILKYKITVLFAVLTLVLIATTLFYENKNHDFQVYLNGNPTEYVSAEEDFVKTVQLSVVKALDCFTYDNNSEQKTTIIMPNNNFYIVDYVAKTITNVDTLEKIEAQVLGNNINDVIITLDSLQEMGGFSVEVDSQSKIVSITNDVEFTLSEKLVKQEKYSYFNPEFIEIYFDFMQANPNLQSREAIIAVNEGLYRPFYEEVETVNNPADIDILINKYFSLPSTYTPVDLVDKGDGRSLRQVAYRAFDEVVKALNAEGKNIYLISAYRGYSRQEYLYNKYVREEGQEYADISSARPGSSEHQTGLAMDILQVSGVANSLSEAKFEDSKEYQWLLENGYKYGLILRYPMGKEDVTGYMYEPWHWRYVGEDVATFMKENEIETFEEFHALKGAGSEKFPQLSKTIDNGEGFLQSFLLEEKSADILAYEVDGLNYYNLEDISRFTNQTKFQFKVVTEENNGRVNLIKGSSSGIGKSYAEFTEKHKTYKISEFEIAVDNFAVDTNYEQYIIDDEIYISLVDLNNILGFDIEWEYTTNSFEFRR